MKKIFLFAAAMLAALSINAETIYLWDTMGQTNYVSTATAGSVAKSTVKIGTNSNTVDAIAIGKTFVPHTASAPADFYVDIQPASGSFLEGDIVKVSVCYNNSNQTKKAVVAIFRASDDSLLFTSGEGTNTRFVDDPAEFTYTLTEDMPALRLGRVSPGNTTTCITALSVVRGEEVVDHPIAPSFSVAAGTYFEPFKFALTSSKADAIYYSFDNVSFVQYTDSIEINQYDVETVVYAYSMLGTEQSEVKSATYLLEHFTPRHAFAARTTLDLANIQASDIVFESSDLATLGTYMMDGNPCPSVSYTHVSRGDGKDSAMIVSFLSVPDISIRYANSGNKADVLKFGAKYVQLDSKNCEIHLSNLQEGDTIVLVATAKGATATRFSVSYSASANLDEFQPDDDTDPCFTDGEVYTGSGARTDQDYCGYTNLVYIVKEGKTTAKIKETNGGARIAKILVGAYHQGQPTALENAEAAAPKAVKRVIDGQVVIEKGGKFYNLLGAEIEL